MNNGPFELDELDELEGIESAENEQYVHHSFVVDKGHSVLRIDKYLADRLANISRSKIQEAADADCILVNEQPVKSNYKVKPGDQINIVLPYPKREIEIIPQDIPLNIVYEDDYILIVNKSPGMVVHPSYGHYSDTLINALTFHLQKLPLFATGDTRPGLVHRIDKNTSGIIVIAKTEEAKNKLASHFFHHTIDRRYVALVWGSFEEETGTITGHIGRHPKDRKIMFVFPDGEHGKHAITHYTVLERLGYVSLIECRLETGRTHQIRAHMKYIGHPLFNDTEYGGNEIIKGTTFTRYKQYVNNCFKMLPRQALHAKSLGLVHPATGEYMFFDSPIPDDMQAVIEKWRGYIAGRESE